MKWRAAHPMVISMTSMSAHRLFQDDLPTTPSISRLRASGVVTAETRSVVVTCGEGESALAREVRVTHQIFPNRGSWSFFVCPACGRPARVLKLHERPMCRRCCLRQGVGFRISNGTTAERAAARAKRIEKLRARLAGGPARLYPRPGRTLDRRCSLEISLKRAMIAARQDLMRIER
jgi:hypothetical protein